MLSILEVLPAVSVTSDSRTRGGKKSSGTQGL